MYPNSPPKASFAPARALSRLAGSHWCHFADGIAREQIANLRRERRRADRLGEDAQAGALERLLRRERRADRAEERRPRADLAEVASASASDPDRRGRGPPPARRRRSRRGCRDAAGCLRSSSAGPRGSRRAARWRRRRAASPSRRRAACPGSSSSGWRTYGTIFSGRLPRAGRDAGERQRRAHQLQERPARDRIGDRFDLRRKFVVQALLKGRIVRPARRASRQTARASPGSVVVFIDGTSNSS